MKKILIVILLIVTSSLHAGIIDGAIGKIWDTAKLIVEKAEEYGASDILQTLNLLDQIACLEKEFELNYDLYENQMGCAMKIKYAAAASNLISAKSSITDYYTDLTSKKEQVESSKEKIQRINSYLESTIEFMQDFNKMIEIDIKEKLRQVKDEKEVEMVTTYTISK